MNGFQVKDRLTPALQSSAAAIADKRPILEAMALQLVSITQQSFSNAELRPASWPARKPRKGDDGHALLRLSGALFHSIRVSGISADEAHVGTDRVYAAIQQLGSKKKSGRGSGIPPRPFFPFYSDGKMTPIAEAKVHKIALAKVASLLRTMA